MTGCVLSLGSLFSGIGGLELGLEMTGGFHTVWQVEQSAFCRQVLAKHWPHAMRYEDVREVGKENLAHVDVICGGFPCQDVSRLGKQAGMGEGTRSGLWGEYARIVREMAPRFVIVENVTGLLTDGLGRVLGDLAELGYDAEWSVLSAADVGATHQRERVFVLAHARRIGLGGYGSKRLASPAGRGWHYHARGVSPDVEWKLREVGQPRILGSINGLPDQVDRNHALGNAVCPPVARVIGEWLLEIDAELREETAA